MSKQKLLYIASHLSTGGMPQYLLKQIQIFESMDWKLPEYAHIPLIHSKEGKKLSKKDRYTFFLILKGS